MPRHQINHHKNENCFAKVICPRCKCEYNKRDKHDMEDCIAYLAGLVKKMQDEKEEASKQESKSKRSSKRSIGRTSKAKSKVIDQDSTRPNDNRVVTEESILDKIPKSQ